MQIVRVLPGTPDAEILASYAETCSWIAGKHLAKLLREGCFSDWECAFAAMNGDAVIGYCTFLKTDYYPDNRYFPWISSMFVDEAHRGKGICGKLIEAAEAYAKAHGFSTVYIPSDMTGFYERYGYEKIGTLENYGGDIDNIFAKTI